MTDVYVCAACGDEFLSDASDDDARQEYVDRFGHEPDDDDVVVCDGCYEQMCRRHDEAVAAWMESEGWTYHWQPTEDVKVKGDRL